MKIFSKNQTGVPTGELWQNDYGQNDGKKEVSKGWKLFTTAALEGLPRSPEKMERKINENIFLKNLIYQNLAPGKKRLRVIF
jgi:hypothetical protein